MPAKALVEELGGIPISPEGISAAPASRGAYALIIELDSPVSFRRSGTVHEIAAGTYVYAGSANGPGGMRARLARHFRQDKKLHWHVDQLTNRARSIVAIALPGESECDIIESLSNGPDFAPALAGFGSSDCRTCATHLLQWRDQAGAGSTSIGMPV